MTRRARRAGRLAPVLAAALAAGSAAQAASPSPTGRLVVQLDGLPAVSLVGALNRWDPDGAPRKPVDPKAAIDAPAVDARARPAGSGRWLFDRLAPGRYDLVILTESRVRIEGFYFAPVLDFDPLVPADARPPESVRRRVVEHIAAQRRYENKVRPLMLAGDAQRVRVLVQLLRDQPTSFDRHYGRQAATIRHELWEYRNYYGGWTKEKKVKVLDRILMPREELRRWTWLWTPQLGGILIGDSAETVRWRAPQPLGETPQLQGLTPY